MDMWLFFVIHLLEREQWYKTSQTSSLMFGFRAFQARSPLYRELFSPKIPIGLTACILYKVFLRKVRGNPSSIMMELARKDVKVTLLQSRSNLVAKLPLHPWPSGPATSWILPQTRENQDFRHIKELLLPFQSSTKHWSSHATSFSCWSISHTSESRQTQHLKQLPKHFPKTLSINTGKSSCWFARNISLPVRVFSFF